MDSKVTFKQVEKYVVTSDIIGKGAFGTVFRGFLKDKRS